ncbi:MAG TPA: SufD family Fe-S cluster assembly protein, partial [Vampirovibrionales bacterium]
MIVEERLLLEKLKEELELDLMQGSASEESKAKRKSNFDRFVEFGFPSRKDEAWKYFNMESLIPYVGNSSTNCLDVQKIEDFIIPECVNNNLIFQDGKLVQSIIKNSFLQHAATSTNKLQEEEINKLDALRSLNRSFIEEENIFEITNSEKLPLQILLYASKFHAQFNKFIVQENTEAELILDFRDSEEQKNLSNIINKFEIKENAHLKLNFLQRGSKNNLRFAESCFKLKRNASVKINYLAFDKNISRHSFQFDLEEEGSNAEINGLYALKGNVKCHTLVEVNHLVPNCSSKQFFKGLLKDSSYAEFTGAVNVSKYANGTSADQLCKNLLLSKSASVDMRPQLEIDA